MIVTVMDAIYDLLNNDATLTGYGITVKVGWVNEDTTFPCITIWEGSESSTPVVGYADGKHRLNESAVQVDVWIDKNNDGMPCTSRDLNEIADRVDELLLGTGVTNTSGWRRTLSVEQQETSVSMTLFHKTRRYDFRYFVKDT